MKYPNGYINRNLQTFKFKGRERRGLLWKKAIYKEWFEYCLLAKSYPDDFGQLTLFNSFEDWWKDPKYGFELFCEPPEPLPILELEHSVFPDEIESRLVVSIDLDADIKKVLFNLERLLQRKKVKAKSSVSKARYQPSKPGRHIKLQKLERYRLSYVLQQEGKKRVEIGEILESKGYYRQPDLREISRDIAKAREIITNVTKGCFP